jgi:hypothetical protein
MEFTYLNQMILFIQYTHHANGSKHFQLKVDRAGIKVIAQKTDQWRADTHVSTSFGIFRAAVLWRYFLMTSNAPTSSSLLLLWEDLNTYN